MPRYVVTAICLNIREEPKLSGKVLGFLPLNDVVDATSISDDRYWRRIERSDGLQGWCSHKYLAAYQGAGSAEEFLWMTFAMRELGVKEYAGAADNPRIVEYLKSTHLAPSEQSQDETPWCSAFVNWCMERAGYEGTDSAWARSWLNWGQLIDEPRRGCVAVFARNDGGHVGFYVSVRPAPC